MELWCTSVWKVDPEKQGLKQKTTLIFHAHYFHVWKVDPEKQGLKLSVGKNTNTTPFCLKGRSRKTRIETFFFFPDERFPYICLKGRSRKTRIETLQVLLLGYKEYFVWKVDPEKQGLKQL